MKNLSRIIVLNALLFWFVVPAFSQMTWTSIPSVPTSNNLFSAASHGDYIVAVGDSGTVLTSQDGSVWSKQSSGVTTRLNKVAWARNQFIAVGDSGIILTSQDGVLWTKRQSGPRNLFSVACNDSQIVVVGSRLGISSILTSRNGISWKIHDTIGLPFFRDIVWTGNQFVAVGISEVVAEVTWGRIATSLDGTMWNGYVTALGEIFSIVWTGTQFVAVGWPWRTNILPGPPFPYDSAIITSSDLTHWTTRSSGSISRIFRSIIWTGSQLFAAGNTICSSSDGIIWESTNFTDTLNYLKMLNSIIWTGKMLVTVGNGGTIFIGIPPKVNTSLSLKKSNTLSDFHVRYDYSRIYISGISKSLTTGATNVAIHSLSGKRIHESTQLITSDKSAFFTGDLKPGVYNLAMQQKGNLIHKSFSIVRR